MTQTVDTITVRDAAKAFGFLEFQAVSETGQRLDDDSHCLGVIPADKNTIAIILTDQTHGAIQRVPPIP